MDLLGLDARSLEWYQMGARAVIVFVIAIVYIRLAGMRTFGTRSAFDVVVKITLGTVLGNAIISVAYSFGACITAAAILVFLHRLIAFLSYRYTFVNKLCEGDAAMLFSNGKKNEKNIEKHSVSEKELIKSMREEGIDHYSEVKSIWLEPDGKISVVKKVQS